MRNAKQPKNAMIEAIIRDVNCVGVVVSQAAKAFNTAFPENERAFCDEFKRGNIEPGKLFVFERVKEKSPDFIFSLPTRIHWKASVKSEYLEAGINAIVEESILRQVSVLKIHKFEEPVNTNSDSITWQQIKLAFLTSFARVPDIRLEFLDRGISNEPRKRITIFTDGGAEPNPGIGGYGVVLRFGDTMKELSQGFELTTNNRMELLAAIVGLESLKESCDVRLYSDSRYIVDAVVTGTVFRWREKAWKNGKVKNIDLWERFVLAYVKHQVECVWVKGHSGIADNERCDELATLAIASLDLQKDKGYIEHVLSKSNRTEKPLKKKANPNSISNGVGKSANNSDSAAKSQSSVATKRGPKPKKVGDPCRNCATPLQRRETKKSNPNSAYYYTWHLHCKNCNRMYHVEAAKVHRAENT